MSEPTSYAIRKIGENRGAPRLWLEGRLAQSAGFSPHKRFRVLVEKEKNRLTLRLDDNGDRKVSEKVKKDQPIPVIDINSTQALSVFEGLERVRVWAIDGCICIEPLATEVRVRQRLEHVRRKLSSGTALSVGSISHGGGILCKAIHDGLAQGGVKTQLAWANDIREELLVHAAEHNPCWTEQTVMLSAPMQELAFDHLFMKNLPEVDIMEGGIPCNGASLAGRGKNGIDCAEAHPDCGHLLVAFLAIVARVNPAIVVLENVPLYRSSASMWIIRHQLRDLGYEVHETEIHSKEWNTIESRKRMCMVAVTAGMEFCMDNIAKPQAQTTRLGDVLEDIALDDPRWSKMQYLKEKQVRDHASGKGFAMHIATPESTRVSTLGSGYAKWRSTETKIQHPHNPDLLRQLTVRENAACKGIDPSLVDGLSTTVAHQVLGQSVTPAPFVSIATCIAQSLTACCGQAIADARVKVTNTAKAVVSAAQGLVHHAARHPVAPARVSSLMDAQIALF